MLQRLNTSLRVHCNTILQILKLSFESFVTKILYLYKTEKLFKSYPCCSSDESVAASFLLSCMFPVTDGHAIMVAAGGDLFSPFSLLLSAVLKDKLKLSTL